LLDVIDEGHCGELEMDRVFVKNFLSGFAFVRYTRELLPALAFRMKRCNQDDIDVILFTYNAMYGRKGFWNAGSQQYSRMLGNHIKCSELWDYNNPPSIEETEAIYNDVYISTGTALRTAFLFDKWPRYTADEYDGVFADYSGPLLMLHGDQDPPAPIEFAEVMASLYNQPNQTFVLFPNAAHGVLNNTPVQGEGYNCGFKIFIDFLTDPHQTLDTSCTQRLAPLDFKGDVSWRIDLMGTNDIWGERSSTSRAGLSRSSASVPVTRGMLMPMPGMMPFRPDDPTGVYIHNHLIRMYEKRKERGQAR
jgi:hypothetical protein